MKKTWIALVAVLGVVGCRQGGTEAVDERARAAERGQPEELLEQRADQVRSTADEQAEDLEQRADEVRRGAERSADRIDSEADEVDENEVVPPPSATPYPTAP